MKRHGRPVPPEETAEAVGSPTARFTPEKGAPSTLFRWFANDDRLLSSPPTRP